MKQVGTLNGEVGTLNEDWRNQVETLNKDWRNQVETLNGQVGKLVDNLKERNEKLEEALKTIDLLHAREKDSEVIVCRFNVISQLTLMYICQASSRRADIRKLSFLCGDDRICRASSLILDTAENGS